MITKSKKWLTINVYRNKAKASNVVKYVKIKEKASAYFGNASH